MEVEILSDQIHLGYNIMNFGQQSLHILIIKPIRWMDRSPDDGQRKCPKPVELYSKNKFEKLVHFVGFIIRIYHNAWSSECQISLYKPN